MHFTLLNIGFIVNHWFYKKNLVLLDKNSSHSGAVVRCNFLFFLKKNKENFRECVDYKSSTTLASWLEL